MTSNGRVARLTALALATGTLVAAGASSAGAATASTTTFTTQGGGSVIHLEVNLPVAVPGLPQQLVQDVVATGTTSRSGLQPAAIANALIGRADNNIPVVSDVLNMSSSAELGKPSSGNQNFAEKLSGLGIQGELLALKSIVANPNVSGTTATGHSAIADLTIDGGQNLNLQALLDALSAQLSGLLSTAQLPVQAASVDGTVTSTTTTVTGLIKDLGGQVADLAADVTGQDAAAKELKTALDQVADLLNALPAALTNQLKSKLTAADSSLLHVGLIESNQQVTRAGDTVTSATNNLLTDISVLGGLVTVEGLKSEATATLSDTASAASPKTTTKSSLLKVNAADVLRLDVTGDLNAVLSSGVLPAEVTDAVNGVLAQVTGLVNGILGAQLELGKVVENVETPDRAAATVSAATLTIDPQNPITGARLLPMDGPLLKVDFVPATAEVVKAQAQTPPNVVQPPARPVAGPDQALARTGAELPLTGAVAAALIGLAAVARRRRMLEQ